jgi:type VI secretion system secreted protein Hcp
MLKTKLLTVALTSVVAALVTAGSAQAATDYFLKVTPAAGAGEPIVGETADREFPGAIEIESFSFGAENATTIGSATGGAGAGKATFQEFTVEKAVDSTTPRLLKSLAMGSHFATVELIARRTGGAGSVTPMRTLFQTVFITKQEQSGSRGEDMHEKLTFTYGGIAQASVSPKSPIKPDTFASWSVITNTPIKDVLAAPYRA